MSWIEQIRMRTSSKINQKLIDSISDVVRNVLKMDAVSFSGIFRHADYPGDLIVMIYWQTSHHPKQSEIGTIIADYLSRYGLIEHAVWIMDSYFSSLENLPDAV